MGNYKCTCKFGRRWRVGLELLRWVNLVGDCKMEELFVMIDASAACEGEEEGSWNGKGS